MNYIRSSLVILFVLVISILASEELEGSTPSPDDATDLDPSQREDINGELEVTASDVVTPVPADENGEGGDEQPTTTVIPEADIAPEKRNDELEDNNEDNATEVAPTSSDMINIEVAPSARSDFNFMSPFPMRAKLRVVNRTTIDDPDPEKRLLNEVKHQVVQIRSGTAKLTKMYKDLKILLREYFSAISNRVRAKYMDTISTIRTMKLSASEDGKDVSDLKCIGELDSSIQDLAKNTMGNLTYCIGGLQNGQRFIVNETMIAKKLRIAVQNVYNKMRICARMTCEGSSYVYVREELTQVSNEMEESFERASSYLQNLKFAIEHCMDDRYTQMSILAENVLVQAEVCLTSESEGLDHTDEFDDF